MNKIILACLFFPIISFAQSRLSDENTIGWYGLFITPKISEKVSAHIEYQWRREDLINNWQQSLLRLGINYKISSQLITQAGYGFIFTHPYGDYTLSAVPKTFPEHRIYEQAIISAAVGKTTLSNRFRLEQRWLGKFTSITDNKPSDWIYLNRIRYTPKLEIPVSKDKKTYISAADEILIGFGKNIGENVFDQNRFFLLAGHKFSPQFKIEAGYLNQIIQLGREIDNKNVFQHNNGLVIYSYINFN